MPVFQYEAMNSVGKSERGTIEAANSDEAIAKIRQTGKYLTKIREKAGKGGSSSAKRSKSAAPGTPKAKSAGPKSVGGVNAKRLTQFTRQLSTLQDAGLPILRALRILYEQQKPGNMKTAIRLVSDDVEAGASLSEAMARHPKAFDPLYTNMVRAGEMGGVLDLILKRLADFMEKSQALKRKIKGAMIYPVAVMIFAFGIVTALLVFVVPRFQTIFSDMGQDLPGPTVMLLGLSKWVKQDKGWIWIIGFPFMIVGVKKLLRQFDGGKMFLDRFTMMIPVIGKIVSQSVVARFTRTLGTLLAAGVPILDALSITAETSGNMIFSRALKNVRDSIREGESIAKPLRQANVVDSMVVNMIDVGEETGELDKMLEKIADTYDEEVDTLVGSLVSLMEPVMVIVLGGIVGFIVIALFLPMVKMVSAMQGG